MKTVAIEQQAFNNALRPLESLLRESSIENKDFYERQIIGAFKTDNHDFQVFLIATNKESEFSEKVSTKGLLEALAYLINYTEDKSTRYETIDHSEDICGYEFEQNGWKCQISILITNRQDEIINLNRVPDSAKDTYFCIVQS